MNDLEQLAELVDERYPKGTEDPFGKALRHKLHKLGQLNDPDPEGPFVVFKTSGESFDVFGAETWTDVQRLRRYFGGRGLVVRRQVFTGDGRDAGRTPGSSWWAMRLHRNENISETLTGERPTG